MRRTLLLAGISAGTLALFTTISYAAERRHRADAVHGFKEKLADLTFCRTGYEIASSRPHYVSRFVEDQGERQELVQLSDDLALRKERLDRMISDHLREAPGLPLDTQARILMVEKVQWEAEVEAVHTAGWVEEPEDFLDHLEERCEPYLTE